MILLRSTTHITTLFVAQPPKAKGAVNNTATKTSFTAGEQNLGVAVANKTSFTTALNGGWHVAPVL